MKTSIVLTIYDQSFNDISRWLKYFKSLREKNAKNLQILILCDNPDLPDYYFKIIEDYGFNITRPSANLKRVGLIKKYIDNGTISGDYLKLCDPDDYFDEDEFLKILNIINNQKDLFINIFEASIYSGYNNSSNTYFDKEKIKKEFWKHPVNFNSFYVVKYLKEQKIDLSFNLCDDFYFHCISMVRDVKVNYIKNCWPYIWSKENGESNRSFIMKGPEYKIYDDLSKFYEMRDFLTSMINLEHLEKIYFPFGLWVLKAIQNNLIASSKINRFFSPKALFLVRKELKKYKLIYNEKDKMKFSLILFIYYKTLFGRKI